MTQSTQILIINKALQSCAQPCLSYVVSINE